MDRPPQLSANIVAAGEDRFGIHKTLGISAIDFKVVPEEGNGVLFIENTFRAKGGPPRHLHLHQDEWFYVLEGEFIAEVGQERITLRPGDSLLGPRNVPHAYAFTGDGVGRILIAFLPAGQMEAFFSEVSKSNAMPGQDPELWRAHGLELVGPPLEVV
jgi:quercetin dioxygenase-like cupin family protein